MPSVQLQSVAYYNDAVKSLVSDHQDINIFALSQIEKISINVGVGKFDAKQKSDIQDYIRKLTGQEPKQVESKTGIAGFNLRKGMVVGTMVTLRGKHMKDFLMNLIYIALPRTRDFKGIKESSMDKSGKVYSLGIENGAIFPTIGFDATVQFGLQVNIVFKSASPMNRELLTKLNFPFIKVESN